MSVLTTTPLKAAPSAAAGVTLANGNAWVYGAWIEVIAATAAPIAIAGVSWAAGSYSLNMWEVDIGVGAVGAETSVGTIRVFLHNSGVEGPGGLILPVPLGGIGAGVRVAVRSRSVLTAQSPARLTLLYYEGLSSDQVTATGQVLSSAPSGSSTASLTPSATPWANSTWVELVPSAAAPLGLLGLVHATAVGADDGVEYDLGTGAIGAETVITTLRDVAAISRAPFTWLPGMQPVPTGTRVAVRMRKAGTNTTAHPVAVLYYTNVAAVVTVPNVVGMTQAAANTALVAVGLVTGTVTTGSHPTVPSGDVISQSPVAGSIVASGSAVDIVVSTGPALVTVPNVVGMIEAAADAALVAVGLTTGTVTSAPNAAPAGQIIAQTPTAGSSAVVGSAVDLVISRGLKDYTWQIEDMPSVTRWMTGLLVFPVGETPLPGVLTPTRVVIPMHVTTRLTIAGILGGEDSGPDDCCRHCL